MKTPHYYYLYPEKSNDYLTHVLNPLTGGQDTLCGIATDNSEEKPVTSDDFQEMIETDNPIDCPKCIEVIRFCKGIKPKEIA